MKCGSSRRGTTRAPRRSSAAPPRSTPTAWPHCSSTIPPRPAGWPGGSATSFSARGPSTTAAIDALAEGLRAHDLDIGWGVATVLRSRLFFDAANLGRRVASPIEFAVGAVRALEMFDPSPSTPVLADWCGRLGQDLFYPPNVGGWPGGRAWITTRSAIGRANLAAALVARRVGRPGAAVRPDRAGRPPWPGAKPVVLRADCCSAPDGPEVPLDAAGAAPGMPRPTTGFARGPADLDSHSLCTGGETMITRRRLPRPRPAGFDPDRPGTDAARLPGAHGPCRRTREGRPHPGRRPARRRQRRHQHGRPLQGRRVRQVPQGDPPAREAADQDQRRGRPAPGDGRRGEAAGIGPAGDRAGRGLSEPEPLALPQHGDLAIGPARQHGPHRAGLGRPRPRRGPDDPRRCPGGDADRARRPPPAIRGRRSVSAALDRLDDYALTDKESRGPADRAPAAGDDLGQFLRRSLLDAYTTADRLEAVAGPATATRRIPSPSWPGGSA